MTTTFSFERATSLGASRTTVWAHASSMAGVNHELGPLLRMTYPPAFASLHPAQHRPGQRLFRSWILVAGVLPIEYDDLALVQFHPGYRFLEQSSMGMIAVWQHQRVVSDTVDGCVVTDTIRFRPRLTWTGPLFLALYGLVFRHRHRRLQKLFGSSVVVSSGVPPNPRIQPTASRARF